MLYTGVTGKISIKKGAAAAVDIAHMSGFSVELTKDIHEVKSLGSDTVEKLPGIKSWTASADGTADFASTSGQKLLLEAYNDGAEVTCSFYLDSTTFLTGNALIESLTINNAADGTAEVSVNLSGTGACDLDDGT